MLKNSRKKNLIDIFQGLKNYLCFGFWVYELTIHNYIKKLRKRKLFKKFIWKIILKNPYF